MQLDLRGTDLATLQGYLEALGGTVTGPGALVGEGWEARLTPSVHRYGAWEFARVVVEFAGDPDRVAAVAAKLRLRAWRGGG